MKKLSVVHARYGVLLGLAFGLLLGVGGYTFIYARDASYLTNDPQACPNCHVMSEQHTAWQRSSHRAVAVCNDCHAPHDTLIRDGENRRLTWAMECSLNRRDPVHENYGRGIRGEDTMNTTTSDPVTGPRERVRVVIEHRRFEWALAALIVSNAIALGLETSSAVMARVGGLLPGLDRTVLAVFVVELLSRFFVYRRRFFHDQWRTFDFLIVVIALMPGSGAFSVLRALRAVRVLRLVSLMTSMRGVVRALLEALPGMASIIGLMALVLYVSAALATTLFGEIAPDFFGDLSTSLFTLFQVMTVEGWPDIARPVMAQSPYAWIFSSPTY